MKNKAILNSCFECKNYKHRISMEQFHRTDIESHCDLAKRFFFKFDSNGEEYIDYTGDIPNWCPIISDSNIKNEICSFIECKESIKLIEDFLQKFDIDIEDSACREDLAYDIAYILTKHIENNFISL